MIGRFKAIFFAILLFPLTCAATEIEFLTIHLMQPRHVVERKTDGIEGLSTYIKTVEKRIIKRLSDKKTSPTWGYLVMAVRDDGKINAWIDSDDQVPEPVERIMLDTARNTKAFTVKKGVLVFALGFATNGASTPVGLSPFPEAWKKAVNCKNDDCRGKDIEAVVMKAWK